MWTFNSEVASVFPMHARQHIPKYKEIINETVKIIKERHHLNAKIVDVGCATGETLYNLNDAGFTNLHGIDSSAAMIDKIKPLPTIKSLTVSPVFFNNQLFDAIICNWTLHFIEQKEAYIEQIFKSAKDDSSIIITDKTSTDPIPTYFYYQLKKQNGVSEQEIFEKEQALKGAMFVHPPEWYIQLARRFGLKIYIFNASFCFTSFLITK